MSSYILPYVKDENLESAQDRPGEGTITDEQRQRRAECRKQQIQNAIARKPEAATTILEREAARCKSPAESAVVAEIAERLIRVMAANHARASASFTLRAAHDMVVFEVVGEHYVRIIRADLIGARRRYIGPPELLPVDAARQYWTRLVDAGYWREG